VHVNLKNKLKFMESVSVLAGSCLHVDTESGLVHAAACLGVRSVVMFGPTNVDWFGYSQNINVAPKQCGNCWWASDSWMDICVMGHEPAICTSRSSISPVEVARRAVSALRDPPGEVCGRSGVELNAFTKTAGQ
jgi:ADP-heptose:LPS heptosyltransferase